MEVTRLQRETQSKLHHNSDTAQAFRSGSDTPSSVQSGGTTASHADPFSNPELREWVGDLEYVFRRRTAPALDNLNTRARRLRRLARDAEAEQRVELSKSADWAEHRARSLAMSRADRVNTCRKRWRSVKCGCSSIELQVGCDAPQLCAYCRKKHWRKWRQRIARCMKIHVSAARSSWSRDRRGMLPGVYLVTLTAPHSGDIETDRESMGRAVRKLLKHGNAHEWWSAYALTWEVTNGADGLGHVHVHMACVSSWIPYASVKGGDDDAETFGPRRKYARRRPFGLHEVWRAAMPGARVLDVQAPNRTRKGGQGAANYLAKYVTKGIDPLEMTGAKAGEMLCAFRGKRKVSTSARFWTVYERDPRCPDCRRKFVGTGHPCSLRELSPAAILRSQTVRFRFAAWEQDGLFAPWEVRPPWRPAEVIERAPKLNVPTRWVLPSKPVSEWAEKIPLQGWVPQHFERAKS